ncbi:hypothetical protein A3A54_01610 [Candidatus Curtissbacteria bacterium RIFCSPLOWO2_01_FULL_39_62]|uniref:Uncharacterized protein n=2 Tax=Candidatus Curtissiibacteriota TaxID=1752717 RepID=A0A1F5G7J8_9BACT|nr:MAG: hypothetical protein A2775_00965 [Candidatus Curtissbacteria bacterium RIFCSPHIGHO2_01_FULL_39_57]OGD87846.1 MAG: hypothetical protein A3D04_02660 [Candidatus Curtissbacteria bacterium RIFCSPHIGHO2_02_FULL_40_16b]OGD90406.1 MAG: hypothetical protein A3E11_00120 [Candidatus Curtissbacteria bacterium RIFCSPHIGHO2_12_FULL_38_37]OGD99784.1 MAG: hypothetical protein A3J17_04345 [Candidatus Curtissbacteria bacterium RIFCSPLOWO2_02_FULL_40_11]OGE00839.1 MAG: hypothetical protein A3A54_01610 [C
MATGEQLTYADIYNENPEVLDEDPEFLLDLFQDAVNKCKETGQPVTLKNVFYQTKVALFAMDRQEYHQHYPLVLSLTEPSIEILRWFPPLAEKLRIEFDLKPLWEYVVPSVTLAFNIHLWNSAHNIIESVPELAKRLKAKEEKPPMTLLDYGDERGLVAVIIDEESGVVIKRTLHDGEESIAKKVAGIVGPEVIESNNNWIVEKFIGGIAAEELAIEHPDIVGAAFGVALRKTHFLDLAYLDRFDRRHLLIDPKTNKVSLVDWSSAKENGNQFEDIRNAVATMKKWFASDQQYLLVALKNFRTTYRGL